MPRAAKVRISKETLGMLLLLEVQTMFFAGFVSAYVVLRLGSAEWRPPGLTDLAFGLPLSNTILLVLSGVTMLLATRCVKQEDPAGLKLYLWATMALGATFVGAQVYEFLRLLKFVPYGGNNFGGILYTVSVLHGVHVLAGIIILLCVTVKAHQGKYHQYRRSGVVVSSLYWYFVVLLWLFLYFALYVV